jgi:exopolyphosphatase/guanosine-5'-triphosphate,3'-diphosphate pyrophosphatase
VKKKGGDGTEVFIRKIVRTYDPDPAHSEQVTTTALALFDGLHDLHGYGSGERRLLEIAGRLHDIGWARTESGSHHKLSRDMILEHDIPGLDEPDRLVCALIARYHTKATPDASRHRKFASLDPGQRELVEWLAGMLRVADGLDCDHAGLVQGLSCRVSGRTIEIHIQARGECRTGVARARQKQDLLQEKAGKKITYRC